MGRLWPKDYLNQIINSDCIDVMREMPDNSIDAIITDPPYGHNNHDGDWNARLNEHRGIDNKPIANDSPDEMRSLMDAMLKEAARILKHDCCCCCCCCGGGGPRPTFAWLAERMDRDGLSFFHSVIWDKRNPGLGWRFRRQHEMIMVSHRSGGRLRWNPEVKALPNILSISPPRDRLHPNQKPEELYRKLINAMTLPGDIILDPFAGSGTIAVTAMFMDRKFIGIELNPEYVHIANERIKQATRQERLFL